MFLNELNDKQREVCISTNNYILTACPGSGKTRTVTYRLAYLQQKYSPSQKYNIAITYTNRAVNEIDSRIEDMGIDLSTIWAGTIHQFCMKFIIRPYAMYSDILCKGYHIIDEYIKGQYCDEIASEIGIKVGYNDPLSFPDIKREYTNRLRENKEIDFDMILDIAYSLLCDHPYIAENISNVIRSIHIDEFQDTNERQYNILAKIFHANNTINMWFVGDVNQAIYGSLGGIAKTKNEIEKLFKVNFDEDCLSGCYRSTQRIVEYYTNYKVQETGVKSLATHSKEKGNISYNQEVDKEELPQQIAEIITAQLCRGISECEICVIAPQWYQIYPMAKQLRKLLPDTKFDAPDIVPFKYDPMNPFYLLAKLIFTDSGLHVGSRKRVATDFLDMMRNEYQISFPEKYDIYRLLKSVNSVPVNSDNGIQVFEEAVKYILKDAKIQLQKEETLLNVYEMFLDRANERIKNHHLPHSYSDFCACFKDREGIVINTIHGIKGEEYTTVIAFDLLNGHLPHWDYVWNEDKKPMRKRETLKLLYVLCSRAKKNLFLFSEKGRITKKGYMLVPTDELNSISYDYDT